MHGCKADDLNPELSLASHKGFDWLIFFQVALLGSRAEKSTVPACKRLKPVRKRIQLRPTTLFMTEFMKEYMN